MRRERPEWGVLDSCTGKLIGLHGEQCKDNAEYVAKYWNEVSPGRYSVIPVTTVYDDGRMEGEST